MPCKPQPSSLIRSPTIEVSQATQLIMIGNKKYHEMSHAGEVPHKCSFNALYSCMTLMKRF